MTADRGQADHSETAGQLDGLGAGLVGAFALVADAGEHHRRTGEIAHDGRDAETSEWGSGLQTLGLAAQDALNLGREIMWSASGPMDGLADGAAFTCEALKMKCRVVMGYGGSNQAALAVTKGEMDSIYVSDTSANNYVKSGQNRAVAAISRKRSRFFPDVPTIFEAINLAPEEAWLIDFRANVEDLGRILVVPPGMSASRLGFLQEAVRKTLVDPDTVAEGERTQRYIDFQDAETTRKRTISVVTDVTPEQKARIIQILAPK